MKTIFLSLSLAISLSSFSQGTLEPIQNIDLRTETTYFKTEAQEVIPKYYLAGSFDWQAADYQIDVTFDVVEPHPGSADVILKTLHIVNNPELFSAFNSTQSGFFIEDNKVYFFMSPFTTLEGLKFQYKAVGGGGNPPPVIQAACQPLLPIKIVVSPANPN